jgi:peptidyl-prolyl cis-trans isomerase SurA
MKQVSIIFCVFLSVSAFAQKQMVDRVIAVVGDNIILQSEIENQYLQAVQQNEGKVDPDMRCQIFDNLVLEKMFLSQAIIDSVTVSPEEVDAELDRRIRYFIQVFGSRDKLEEYYGKSSIELKDDFRTDIQNQLLSDKMRGNVFSGLKISPAEVAQYFATIPDDSVPYFNSELELGEIVMFPKVSGEQKEIARKKLEKIRTDIINGSDFSLQAILYSEDPGSATEGGSLGEINRGELVPEFEAVAFKLKPGELSEITETPFGFHLIMVDEKRGDKLKLRHILVRPKSTNADNITVRNTMDSVLAEIKAGRLSWRDAVRQYSEEEQSKSIGGLITNPKSGGTYFEKADMDGTLIFTVDRMKVGEYSDVIPYSKMDQTGEMKQGYRIIWLKTETQPHKASLDLDYSRIQSAAKADKQQKALEKWIMLHRDMNYIRIDDSMKSCSSIAKFLVTN